MERILIPMLYTSVGQLHATDVQSSAKSLRDHGSQFLSCLKLASELHSMCSFTARWTDKAYPEAGACVRPSQGGFLDDSSVLSSTRKRPLFAINHADLPSPSISGSHSSPMPSLSVSLWSGLCTFTQLSQTSPTPSESLST